MVPSRHVSRLVWLVAAGAIAVSTRVALAVTPSDPVPTEDQAAATDGESEPGQDAGDDAPIVVAPMPSTFVEVSGAMSGSLASSGEARTTWKYGRSRGVAVDETIHRIRVAGSGRTPAGLRVGFSVALLVPALSAGTYDSSGLVGVAAAWARQDRTAPAPEIEWDASVRDAGPAGFVVTVTSIGETFHSSERRGGVTVDVTDFRVHGSIEATLPCSRSVASLRQSCRTETLHGTF
jgi:hypothetical protein